MHRIVTTRPKCQQFVSSQAQGQPNPPPSPKFLSAGNLRYFPSQFQLFQDNETPVIYFSLHRIFSISAAPSIKDHNSQYSLYIPPWKEQQKTQSDIWNGHNSLSLAWHSLLHPPLNEFIPSFFKFCQDEEAR